MRSITFHYRDVASLKRDLRREEPELPLPADQRGTDGEWVLAVFKVEESGRTATASAARIEERAGGFAIIFEPRDWERIVTELAGPITPPATPATPRAGPTTPAAQTPPTPRNTVRMKTGQTSTGPKSVRPRRATKSSHPPPSKRAMKSMPPPSQRGTTVLTRTLVPPPAAEIHEADAPDHTLEAPIDQGSLRAAAHRGQPRLLLVDDDRDTQEIVREMLEAIGMVVDCASDGEEALDRLVLEPFDLVVLDWNLPRMDGIELCREIRKHPRLGGLPVLFLTAKSTSRDLVDAFAAGADDFVAKPFRAPELGARLLALLRRTKIGLSLPPPPK